jgi:hypothetical protein
MAISTNGTIITRLAGALYGEYLSNATYEEVKDTSAATLAASFLSNDFSSKTDTEVATTVLTNLGLTTANGFLGDALVNYVASQLTAAGSTSAAKGAKLVSMLNDYAGMSADPTYGVNATSFNAKTAASLTMSQTTGSVGGAFATADVVSVGNQTITLTDTVATVNGNVGDDSFYGADSTFQNGDRILAGAGNDSLELSFSSAANVTRSVSLDSIERVAVYANTSGTSTTTLSAAQWTGLTTLQVNDVTTGETLAITDLSSIPSVTLNKGTGSGAVTLTANASVVAGTADSISVAMNSFSGAGTLTANGVETFNVSVTGDDGAAATIANAITLATNSTNTKSVIITGEGEAQITTDGVYTMNGSAATGALTLIATGTTTGINNIAGGTGADTIRFTADYSGAAATLDVVNGGDGTDTLNISAFSTTAGEVYGSTNIEILRLESASATMDISQFGGYTGFTTVKVDVAAAGGETLVLNNLASTTGISVSHNTSAVGSDAITLTATLKSSSGTADALTVTLQDLQDDAAALTLTTLTAANIETINLVASALGTNVTGTGEGVAVATLTAAAAETLNVTGSSAVTLGGTTAITVPVVNATGFSGVLTITAGAEDMSIVGGSANDSIRFNTTLTSADTVNGGDGTDTVRATIGTSLGSAPTLTSIEKLQLNTGGANTSINLRNTSIATLEITEGGATANSLTVVNMPSTLTNLQLANVTTAGAGTVDGVTISGAFTGTADSFTVTFDGTGSGAADHQLSTGAISVSGVETLNVVIQDIATSLTVTTGIATGATTTSVVITGGDDGIAYDLNAVGAAGANLTSFNSTGLSGSLAVDITGVYADAVVNLGNGGNTVTIAASTDAGVTGSAVVTGGSGADNVTGTANADNISTGSGDDVLTGGGGLDYLTGGNGADTFELDDIILTANAVTITDFTVEDGDIIQIDVGTYDLYTAADAVVVVTAAIFAALTTATDNSAGGGSNYVIVDTAANIATLRADTSSGTTFSALAIASDTGTVYFDADGNYTAGSIEVGYITITGTLTGDNFVVGA